MDNIVRPEQIRQMIIDFYRHFDDAKLSVLQEVLNGVWNALSDGRTELAIGATHAILIGGRYAFQDMGVLSRSCVVASHHPLALMDGPFSDGTLCNQLSLARKDTSRTLPKRITRLLDNQKRLVVPDWELPAACISAGLCIGMVPTHFAEPWPNEGKWVALELGNPSPDSACCLTRQQNDISSALIQLLEYLGDNETLNEE